MSFPKKPRVRRPSDFSLARAGIPLAAFACFVGCYIEINTSSKSPGVLWLMPVILPVATIVVVILADFVLALIYRSRMKNTGWAAYDAGVLRQQAEYAALGVELREKYPIDHLTDDDFRRAIGGK
jgi:hypothetical protein